MDEQVVERFQADSVWDAKIILASDKEFIESLVEFYDPALGRVNWLVAK